MPGQTKRATTKQKAAPATGVDSAPLRIGAQGRIVLPAEVRARLGVKTGDELVARVEGARIVLMRPEDAREEALISLRAKLRHVPKGRSLSAELIAARRSEAARE